MLFLNNSQVETELGKRFKSCRLNRNLSQAELAERCGLSRRTITALEHGEGTTLATFIAVLRGLHKLDSLDDFLPHPGISPLAMVLRDDYDPNPPEYARKDVTYPAKYAKKPRKATKTEPWKWGDEK